MIILHLLTDRLDETIGDRLTAELVVLVLSEQCLKASTGWFRAMSTERVFINCPGCDVVVDPTRAVCPGCGRCIGCGNKRGKHSAHCEACELPFCTCCGVCPNCHCVRYSGIIAPCECGHPHNAELIRFLIQHEAVKKRGTGSKPWWQFW